MLRSLRKNEYKNYLDWAYGLALDMTRSGYPTYADGLKPKSEFEEAAARVFEREHEEILLFEIDGKALGWLHYFALPEDQYLDMRTFCTEDQTEQTIDELLAYLAPKYPGFTMHFGFSTQNTRAVNHLIELGWTLQEESLVGVMKFEEYTPRQETVELTAITAKNFERFAAIHAQWDGRMYWDNAHLWEDLDRWHLYVYQRDGQDMACIYFICIAGMLQIFGMDYLEGRFDETAFRTLLLRALNQGKAEGMESFYYFHDANEAPTVKELGIHSLGKYVMYSKRI